MLRWLFHCEPVRGPLICRGGAWAGRLRRRYPPCQVTGASLAALPAVLWVAAHDSHPASYPTNVTCNSPDTVSHRAPISLELQRLRTLLKVHPIELHAKLLRARELPAFLAARVDPCVTCLPVASPSNGGNCTIRSATRRRHAEGRLLMLQNPHHYRLFAFWGVGGGAGIGSGPAR